MHQWKIELTQNIILQSLSLAIILITLLFVIAILTQNNLTSRLVVVVVVVLRVLDLVMELMVSWGESQSWKTCVVAMATICDPLSVSQLKLH